MKEIKINKTLSHDVSFNLKIQSNSVIHVFIETIAINPVDYIQSIKPTLSQIAKAFFKKNFKIK